MDGCSCHRRVCPWHLRPWPFVDQRLIWAIWCIVMQLMKVLKSRRKSHWLWCFVQLRRSVRMFVWTNQSKSLNSWITSIFINVTSPPTKQNSMYDEKRLIICRIFWLKSIKISLQNHQTSRNSTQSLSYYQYPAFL